MSATRQSRIDPPLPLGINCQHCGQQLMVTAIRHHDLEISGLRDLDYRHIDGTEICWIPHYAGPYDGWRATKEFERALQDRHDAEDAALADAEGESAS